MRSKKYNASAEVTQRILIHSRSTMVQDFHPAAVSHTTYGQVLDCRIIKTKLLQPVNEMVLSLLCGMWQRANLWQPQSTSVYSGLNFSGLYDLIKKRGSEEVSRVGRTFSPSFSFYWPCWSNSSSKLLTFIIYPLNLPITPYNSSPTAATADRGSQQYSPHSSNRDHLTWGLVLNITSGTSSHIIDLNVLWSLKKYWCLQGWLQSLRSHWLKQMKLSQIETLFDLFSTLYALFVGLNSMLHQTPRMQVHSVCYGGQSMYLIDMLCIWILFSKYSDVFRFIWPT